MVIQTKQHKQIFILLAMTIVLVLSKSSAAESNNTNSTTEAESFAEKIIQLRARIDSLSREVSQKETAKNDRLRTLRQHKAHLEMRLNAEKIRFNILSQTQSDKEATQAALDADATQLLEPTKGLVHAMRQHVEKALPFKQSERLAALDKIERLLDPHQSNPSAALGALWRFLEDEATLNSSFELNQEVLLINGKRRFYQINQ